jgi:hypothetical protein
MNRTEAHRMRGGRAIGAFSSEEESLASRENGWLGHGYGRLDVQHEKWEKAGCARLLSTWLDLLRKFETWNSREELEDVPWWYGERTLTGLLAAAAWKSHARDWWALEEFANERTGQRVPKHSGGKPLRKLGRGDLWLGLRRRGKCQHSFTIEAKQTSVGGDAIAAAEAIEWKLQEARRQLSKVRGDFRFGLPVAVCCYWPRIPKSKFERRPVRSLFNGVAERLCCANGKGHRNRMCAARWHRYDHAPTSSDDDGEYRYPGVLLAAEIYPNMHRWKTTSLTPWTLAQARPSR